MNLITENPFINLQEKYSSMCSSYHQLNLNITSFLKILWSLFEYVKYVCPHLRVLVAVHCFLLYLPELVVIEVPLLLHTLDFFQKCFVLEQLLSQFVLKGLNKVLQLSFARLVDLVGTFTRIA